jgi:hypothetical protein
MFDDVISLSLSARGLANIPHPENPNDLDFTAGEIHCRLQGLMNSNDGVKPRNLFIQASEGNFLNGYDEQAYFLNRQSGYSAKSETP